MSKRVPKACCLRGEVRTDFADVEFPEGWTDSAPAVLLPEWATHTTIAGMRLEGAEEANAGRIGSAVTEISVWGRERLTGVQDEQA